MLKNEASVIFDGLDDILHPAHAAAQRPHGCGGNLVVNFSGLPCTEVTNHEKLWRITDDFQRFKRPAVIFPHNDCRHNDILYWLTVCQSISTRWWLCATIHLRKTPINSAMELGRIVYGWYWYSISAGLNNTCLILQAVQKTDPNNSLWTGHWSVTRFGVNIWATVQAVMYSAQ